MTEVSDFYCHQVLSGLVEVRVVEETERALAYHHTRPSHPVHIVVIPKQHVGSLTDLAGADEHLLPEVVALVQRVAAQVVQAHGACSVITNLGDYQESKHLHWHLIHRGETQSEIHRQCGHHDT
ncbi:HIT family protein [Streptomyces katrae]|uniref:HIT family protein n=1 Tax=Streptomyces katrae TaxID=68223 RepID=UPI0004C1D9C4|nr:HIT domain-containing protein [Streptomyces katrae]